MADQNRATSGRNSIDDVIAVYKRDVDRTLLRENLKKSPTERLQALQEMQRFAEELHLDTLIRLKRAAGRPKDLETIAELELRRDEE